MFILRSVGTLDIAKRRVFLDDTICDEVVQLFKLD